MQKTATVKTSAFTRDITALFLRCAAKLDIEPTLENLCNSEALGESIIEAISERIDWEYVEAK